MNVPLSLIIPVYNDEKYVSEALQSVGKQTLDSSLFEVVIVNDGSTDRTGELIDKEVKGINNARVIPREENRGISFTKNQAIKESNGKYIVILESDDLLMPSALEATLDFMNENPSVCYSYSGHKRIDENGKDLNQERVGDFFSRKKLLHYNFVGHLRCFTKEIHNLIGGFDESIKVCEDWNHVLKASEILREDQIKHNPRVLYSYRLHGSNISGESKRMVKWAKIVLRNSIKRKEGLDVEVIFKGKKDRNSHSLFDWAEK